MCPQENLGLPDALNHSYFPIKSQFSEHWKSERNLLLLISHPSTNGIAMEKRPNLIPDSVLDGHDALDRTLSLPEGTTYFEQAFLKTKQRNSAPNVFKLVSHSDSPLCQMQAWNDDVVGA